MKGALVLLAVMALLFAAWLVEAAIERLRPALGTGWQLLVTAVVMGGVLFAILLALPAAAPA